jgi:predicted enzyme related to lactoylglutathione lyase
MFCWMDLKTHDVGAPADFLAALLGWECTGAEEDPRRATSVYAEGVRIGGVSDLSLPPYPPGLPAHIAYHIAVDDADGCTAAAEAAGARVVVEPFDAGDQGRVSTLVDPVGAAVSLWEGRSFRGWTRPRSMRLACAEPERAADFYTRVLGGVPRGASIVRGDTVPAWELVLANRDPATLAGPARERGGAVMREDGVTRLRSAEGLSFVLGATHSR